MSSIGDLHDISTAIGRLQAEMDNARRSREITHQRLDAMTCQLEELAILARDVAVMKSEVDHYTASRQRMAGAMALLTLISAGVGGAVSFFVNVLHR